jgi:FkbM family methyltransferase
MKPLEFYFAEFETDRVIRTKYFSDFDYHGTMIEVGGGTPSYLSMSKHFKMNGWRCVIIEPNPTLAKMHKKAGNEIYEYACSDEDRDDADFQIMHCSDDYEAENITDHSFSSIHFKKAYLDHISKDELSKFQVINIKVKIRKLDTILKDINLQHIDLLSIDVEGWELEVLKGFSLQEYKPKVVVLENWTNDPKYNSYMKKFGYKLDSSMQYNCIFLRRDA